MKVLNLTSLASTWSDRSGLGTAVAAVRPAGRCKLPKIQSLLFEVELEDTRPQSAQAEPSATMTALSGLVEVHSELESQVLEHWQDVAACPGSDSTAQLAELAQRLRRAGCSASVLTSPGSSTGGSAALRSLRHTWLAYTQGAETGIFDPAFRDDLTVLNPSPGYARLLAYVPAAFCGTEQRLQAAVQLLCKEMESEFAAKGLALPPWRSTQALLSKWQPGSPQQQSRSPQQQQRQHQQQPAQFRRTSAPQLQLPRQVSSGFPLGSCTATITAARSSAKSDPLPQNFNLYRRMSDGMGHSSLLSSGR